MCISLKSLLLLCAVAWPLIIREPVVWTQSLALENPDSISEEAAPEAVLEPASDITFTCDHHEGIPVTFAQIEAEAIPLIVWDFAAIAQTNSTPEALCEGASERLQASYREGSVAFITTGMVDGEIVVCTAAEENGVCEETLFPLSAAALPNRRPRPALDLQRILRIQVDHGGPIYETPDRIYVNLQQLLEGAYPTTSALPQSSAD